MNKYLVKIAGYHYDEAGHRAAHAEAMSRNKTGVYPGYSYTHDHMKPRGGPNYRDTFRNRATKAVGKTGLKGALIGAGLTGALAYSGKTSYDSDTGRMKKLTQGERIFNGLAGGVIGATVGHTFGKVRSTAKISGRAYTAESKAYYKAKAKASNNGNKFREAESKAYKDSAGKEYQRNYDDFFKGFSRNSNHQSKYSSGNNHGGARQSASTAGIHDLHKELEFPSGGFKTKSEAKTHFRRMASKYHPDKHPNKADATAKMQKINAAWDKYQKHPEGFTKLANAYLDKLASFLI